MECNFLTNIDIQIYSWLVRHVYLQVRQTELDLPVQTAGSHQGRIQCVWSIGGHQNFDVATRVETIQLVDELQHSPLDLIVSAGAVIKPGTWQIEKRDRKSVG